MSMQEAINQATKAKWEVVSTLDKAHRAFHTNPEYAVLIGRIEDSLKTLEETINQMTRIQKSQHEHEKDQGKVLALDEKGTEDGGIVGNDT